ncbi:MAG: chemotaxis protein CheB [Comamonadaceae bacterium]|nr:MAG: chemotaxis protein CheB [Comamonadaceae bacterium]
MKHVRDIVVIGASLGGVTAIAKIALGWPAYLPATVLVALSMPDQPPAVVLQIIDSYAPVRVAFATEGEAIKLRHIYLSPPNKHLVVGTGGMLRLDSGNAFDSTRPSVNRLFASAAAVYGPRVIAIVLSGNTPDGAQGMLDVEKAGGVGIVQAPEDAVDPTMPRSTIQNDHPRYCVQASQIAGLVQRLMTQEDPSSA